MTAPVDQEILRRYEHSAALRRSSDAEATGELRTRRAEVAERVAANQEALTAIGRSLTEPRRRPAPARRPEDNDISAKAEAYQEPEEDLPAPVPVPTPPVARRPVEEDEVPSFRWDEDPPARETPAVPVPPAPPALQALRTPRPDRRAATREEEDLSEHDWLE